jgi:anti-sigma factor ChrR (cupin superfamily)
MKHRVATDEIRDLAAAYSLGVLEPAEAVAFKDHLIEGCQICGAELEGFGATVSALGLSAAEKEPPRETRSLLLSTLNVAHSDATASQPQFLSVRGGEGDWQEMGDGVLIKPLFVDNTSGLATSLVRMLPGTSLPPHRHPGVEQFFVIEGDCCVHGEALGPGDYHRAETGSIHESTYTVNGTMFLLVAPDHYEVLEAH